MSVWFNKRVGSSRVPAEILKQSKMGSKCADPDCNFIHVDSKKMFLCKAAALPIGISEKNKNLITVELAKEGLKLEDGCGAGYYYNFLVLVLNFFYT